MKAGSGTVAQMTAEPRVGYRLKKWTVDGAALTSNCTDTSNPISFTVSGRNVNVSAEFEEFNGTIEVDNSFVYSGKVICPEGFENNKPYGVGTELTFKMQGNDDYAPNLWILTCGNTEYPQRISGSEITVEVTGEPITLYPVFIGKPCTLTYPDGLTVNWLDEFLNPPVLSGKTVPKGSKICISNASENETLLLNGKEIEWTNGFYEFLIEGDTVIQRQSDLTATTEQTTTISTASESKTTASSASESETIASSASESTTTVSSASESETTASSASESKTTVSSASESKITVSSASESETTVSSASESETTASSASESKTTVSSASESEITVSSASESETTVSSASESKTTVSSASESKTTTTSSSVSTGTSSSVSATSPTVSTSGTTVSAETTTSAVRTETATSTESASSTTETTSAVPERIPGDVNGDGSVNLKDVTLIRRSIAGGWNITMDESAADVNGDHAVNLKDVTLIRRYIAGGWNVTLK
jgi:hypothetical protein